jgi:hypothetical protein
VVKPFKIRLFRMEGVSKKKKQCQRYSHRDLLPSIAFNPESARYPPRTQSSPHPKYLCHSIEVPALSSRSPLLRPRPHTETARRQEARNSASPSPFLPFLAAPLRHAGIPSRPLFCVVSKRFKNPGRGGGRDSDGRRGPGVHEEEEWRRRLRARDPELEPMGQVRLN